MANESMMQQLPSEILNPAWYERMANAFQNYGIYFLVIFVFVIVVFVTSQKYSKACENAINTDTGNISEAIEHQRTWRQINYAAWIFGGAIALLAIFYWIYVDLSKPKKYAYQINFEGVEPGIQVDTPEYYKKTSQYKSNIPGMEPRDIFSSSFIIVVNRPFQKGDIFHFNVFHYECNASNICGYVTQQREIHYSENDCNGTMCVANYRVLTDKFEKTLIAKMQNGATHYFAQAALN